jgi:hypothetical protein
MSAAMAFRSPILLQDSRGVFLRASLVRRTRKKERFFVSSIPYLS